jgi:hypothetical protein
MSRTMDQIIESIEEDIKQYRLKKLDANGDLYEDNEDYNFYKESSLWE